MVVFVSNFASPHTIPFCESLIERGIDVLFIETMRMTDERKSLNYQTFSERSFVINFDRFSNNVQEYKQIILNATTVIASYGSIDIDLLSERIRKNKLTFFMSERLLKRGVLKLLDPRLWRSILLFNRIKKSNVYLLAVGNYAASDYRLCGFNSSKILRFAYFTQATDQDVSIIVEKKRGTPIKILWVGRLIWWKRPMQLAKAVSYMNRKNSNYTVDFIGDGPLRDKLERFIEAHQLKNVIVHGKKDSETVSKMMIDASIFVSTSNQIEGWGAVVSEAENCACTIVCNNKVGAAQYLVVPGRNGIIYRGGARNLAKSLTELINSGKLEEMQRESFSHINNIWSAEHAADNFLIILKSCDENGYLPDSLLRSLDVCGRAFQ